MAEERYVNSRSLQRVVVTPGDLIEIFRLGYQHWAVYVGSGYVIHLSSSNDFKAASTSSIMSVMTEKAVVKKELLDDIVGDDVWQVNNKYDHKYRPLPTNKIVQEAESLLGKELHYSLTKNNCEHFVTRLRYGTPRSDQVRDTLIAGTVGLAGVGVMVVLAAAISSVLLPRNRERR